MDSLLILRSRLAPHSDWFLIATAAAFPWSTSATAILVVLWLVAFVPTVTLSQIADELKSPTSCLPILLVLLAILGVLWSEGSLLEGGGALRSFAKLALIPLIVLQFRRSVRAHYVFVAFLASCTLLLIASIAITLWPSLPRRPYSPVGVPVKDYIIQSIEFATCSAALLHFAYEWAKKSNWILTGAFMALSLAFLFDIYFIAISRTAVAIAPMLFLIYAVRRFGFRGLVGAVTIVGVMVAAAWFGSPYFRARVGGISGELQAYQANGSETSSGLRLAFWSKSLHFLETAPVIGHGTGSTVGVFREASVGKVGVQAEVTSNPHNQTLAIGIQLGSIGMALLWAMWLFQIDYFRVPGGIAWIGSVIVLGNFLGSFFNSFIFDFSHGWLYVIGFGAAKGALEQQMLEGRKPRPSNIAPKK